jgi:hypothetical protein
MQRGLGLCGATLQNMLTQESSRLQVARSAMAALCKTDWGQRREKPPKLISGAMILENAVDRFEPAGNPDVSSSL